MIIPVDLTGKELENFQPGSYSFIVSSADLVFSDDADQSNPAQASAIRLTLTCTTAPYQGKPLFHRMGLPQPSDEPATVFMKKKMLKQAVDYFKIPIDQLGLNHELFVGKSCNALVIQKAGKDGGLFDNIAKWL